jgi:predicted amidophosphoribosyltransferase
VRVNRSDGRLFRLLDILIPERCAACGAGECIVCAGCLAGLTLLRGPLCARCGAPTAWPVERCSECSGRRLSFRRARAAVAYEGPARTLVAAWKERGLRRLARLFAGLVVDVVERPPVQALTFIPGERDRVLKRGENTSETLARLLGLEWDLPVEPLLERTRQIPPQRGLTRQERRKNVRGAFAAAAAPAAVAVVDDVYTTGATVGAAATELRRAGCREVQVVTFARAVRR